MTVEHPSQLGPGDEGKDEVPERMRDVEGHARGEHRHEAAHVCG